MKIENISTKTSFNAKVSKTFRESAETFMSRRCLPRQFNDFNKKLHSISYCGEHDSVIVHKSIPQENGFQHLLCLKNEKLNNKSAVIMYETNKFHKLINYFLNLTDDDIIFFETALKK